MIAPSAVQKKPSLMRDWNEDPMEDDEEEMLDQ